MDQNHIWIKRGPKIVIKHRSPFMNEFSMEDYTKLSSLQTFKNSLLIHFLKENSVYSRRCHRSSLSRWRNRVIHSGAHGGEYKYQPQPPLESSCFPIQLVLTSTLKFITGSFSFSTSTVCENASEERRNGKPMIWRFL